jgi:hypothetical protein
MYRILLITFACWSIALNFAKAQATQSIADSTINAYLKQINYWSSYYKNAGYDNDSLLAANTKLMQYLKILTKSKESLNYSLPLSEASGLINLSASNGQLRAYVWDSWLNTDMHYFNELIQYRSSDTCAVNILNDITDTTQHTSPGAYFTEINVFTTNNNKPVYLFTDCTIASNNLKASGIKAYTVNNDKLSEYPIFKTKSHLNSSIEYVYEAAYDAATTLTQYIHFSNNRKTLYIPVVEADRQLRKAYWVYEFNGNNFVYKKKIKS